MPISTNEFLGRELGPTCSRIPVLVEDLGLDQITEVESRLAALQLARPTMPLGELALHVGAPFEDVRRAARFLRDSKAARILVGSPFYPHRLAVETCASVVADWKSNPDRARRLVAGEPMLSRVVEIHPSLGTCAYRCAMCLWSDKDEFTYRSLDLSKDGLVGTARWVTILAELRSLGARTVVISGGGEALLNRDLHVIMRHARELGLQVHLYTTGFNLPANRDPIWGEVARADRVRFSVHSPDRHIYSRIAGLPAGIRSLDIVANNIRRLLRLRAELQTSVAVGVGFVVQPLNFHHIGETATFVAHLGCDFLNIRKDEVDVTRGLTADQWCQVVDQLVRTRELSYAGAFGRLEIDYSDDLTMLANGGMPLRQQNGECMAKFFRPAISPFGLVTPCDLKAEPRFADTEFEFGTIVPGGLEVALARISRQFVPDGCTQCMPSSRTGNAVYAKLLRDLRDGFSLTDQPFSREN